MMDVDVPNGNATGNGNSNSSRETTFFVVQKCWFSGPTAVGMDVPTDYLRLLTTQQHAEEIACLSAHAFNNASSNSNSSNNSSTPTQTPSTTTPVRTIVLPHGGGYAFLAAGKIFWVRRLQATVVSVANVILNFNNSNYYNHNDENQNQHQHLINIDNMTAHAVVTEHVIGGTGNRNSRRGQEVGTGRVFVGDGGASGQAAMVAAQQLGGIAGKDNGNGNVNIRVTWLPIGMPDENASNHNHRHAHLQEWPDRHLWVQQQQQNNNNSNTNSNSEQQPESCFKQQRDDSECSYYSVSNPAQPDIQELDANHVFGTSATNMTMDTTTTSTTTMNHMNSMLMAPPAAKRQCRQPDTVAMAASAFSWPTR
jgi:hypothetical protein